MAKRAVIFANGELPDAACVSPLLKQGDYLIAVDGGLHHFQKLEKTPHLLIGDLDSVTAAEVEQAERQGVEVMRFKVEKDETDLELALILAAEKGFNEILIFAALGGRLDQTLTNLSLLMLPALADLKVLIENGSEEVFLIRETVEIKGKAGDVVSLIPLNGKVVGVETRALKYPLKSETLLPEKSRGVSNVMLADQAGVSIKSGCLLCIHNKSTLTEER